MSVFKSGYLGFFIVLYKSQKAGYMHSLYFDL